MVIHKTFKTTVMEKALKQKSLKKIVLMPCCFQVWFITGFAWCFLAKPQLLWSCGFSRHAATIKAGWPLHISLHGQSRGCQENPQFCYFWKCQFFKCGSRCDGGNTRNKILLDWRCLGGEWSLAGAGWCGWRAGEVGTPASAYKYSCICLPAYCW